MNGLAETYGRIVKRELNAHAAWFPVSNTLEVGDYGLIDNGTFRPIGKISQQYPDIKIETQAGNQSTIDFKSQGTSSVVLDLQGNAKTFQALGNADAQLKVSFTKENSAMIKTSITVKNMTNVADVANRLNKKSDWQNRYKVVSAVYIGKNATVLCTREAGTEVIISGKADVLQAVDAGKADVSVEVKSNKSGVFSAVGKTGVVAIDLFKLRLLGGGVKTLEDLSPSELVEPVAEANDDI